MHPTLTIKAMKKSLLILAMFIGGAVTAQDNMTSKKGTPILPEAGDWSIGIGANSTLNYFGNLMNGNNSAPSFDWQNPQNVLQGKMMKDENTAYRLRLRLGLGSTKKEGQNVDTDNDGNPDTDSAEVKTSATNINLGAGIQKYRGKGRLKGIYGGEANIGLSGGKTTIDAPGYSSENKMGSTFSLGIRGFIGIEYFFAPKMSLGGEFGWGIAFSSTGEGENSSTSGGVSSSSKTGKSSSFGLDTDNASGSLVLNFYF